MYEYICLFHTDFSKALWWALSEPKRKKRETRSEKRQRGMMGTRADKGWGVKRARPSKKVWCSGLGLCLEMPPVFDFGQGDVVWLFFRHCRCHWIMAARVVFLHFFLVPFCWYVVSKRQMLLIFCGRFSWSKQTSLSNGFPGYFHDSTTELYFRYITPMSMLYQNKNN